MESFIAVLHILVALVLISLVLVQDTKSGSVGVFGGGGSNSVLGATGATTLAQKMTRWSAGLFAVTCILLTTFANRTQKSLLDSVPVSAPVAAPSTAPTGPSGAPAPTAPAQEAAPTSPSGPQTAPSGH